AAPAHVPVVPETELRRVEGEERDDQVLVLVLAAFEVVGDLEVGAVVGELLIVRITEELELRDERRLGGEAGEEAGELLVNDEVGERLVALVAAVQRVEEEDASGAPAEACVGRGRVRLARFGEEVVVAEDEGDARIDEVAGLRGER